MTAVTSPLQTAGRKRLLVLLLVAVVAALFAVAPSPLDLSAEAALTDTAHPFSDPEWYPLRTSGADIDEWRAEPPGSGPWSSIVSCVKDNCDDEPEKPNDPHGYWAIDFIADKGDAIYAAGAGTAYIGGNSGGCRETKEESDGRWVWIDHGGGIVSRYHHLDSINITPGQKVTPTTKIGEVGSSGDFCGQEVNYLHFELRKGGVQGMRTPIGQLRACDSGTALQYPKDLPKGYDSWDQVPYRDLDGAIPKTDSSCIPPDTLTPHKVDNTGGSYGNQRATVTWSAPRLDGGAKPVDYLVISKQIWRTVSGGYWSDPAYLRINDTSARRYTYTGLTNGRKYKFRVQWHNPVGFAKWGEYKEITPGAPPDAPTKRRLSATDERIGFAWYKPDENGRKITQYQTAIRRQLGDGTWTPWVTDKVGPLGDPNSYTNFYGLTPNRRYGVRVRANSKAGYSDWSPAYTIWTLKN